MLRGDTDSVREVGRIMRQYSSWVPWNDLTIATPAALLGAVGLVAGMALASAIPAPVLVAAGALLCGGFGWMVGAVLELFIRDLDPDVRLVRRVKAVPTRGPRPATPADVAASRRAGVENHISFDGLPTSQR